MADPQQAIATQLQNIEKRTGRSLAELGRIVRASGLTKHGEIRDMLKRDLGMGHGDANTLVHHLQGSIMAASAPAGEAAVEDTAAALYTGEKAALHPIHMAIMAALRPFGDFEIAPKKAYVSLRRKKQFATVGPATKTQVEVGLNMKGVPPTSRLVALPPGGMCQYKIRLSTPAEVDRELIGWIRTAFDAAG